MNLTVIAANLPGQWSVYDTDELKRADGMRLWLREGGYGNEGKIRISFSRPRDAKGQCPTLWMKSPGTGRISDPAINVSNTKTPEQIAKDIARRLLPEAEVVFGLANESINLHNKFENDKVEAIETIANVCGISPERHYQSKELTGEVDPYKGAGLPSFQGNGYGKFKISGKDSISLELNSMNLDVAIEIAEALREIFKKRAANENSND